MNYEIEFLPVGMEKKVEDAYLQEMEKKGQFIKIKFGWLELVERLKEIPGTKAFKLDHYSKIFLLPRLIVRTNVMFNYNIP